jgi:hypothetical protein
MKLLDLTFRKDGFDFTQLCRSGDWCVYSKTKTGFKNTFYEVMKIKNHNGREIAGKQFPPAEFLPSSEEWGTNAFSFSSKELAMRFWEVKAK